MATVLGSLLVSLGLESANFRKGLSDADRQMQRAQQKFQRIGKQMASVGKAFSAGITAPVLGAAAAFTRAAGKMADEAREMANAARVAGEGFEEFQRQAAAARTVGIEADKLGDIFKDVRERIGEFVVTGGGPLQDAFDALNGKVKLTVDELRGLSGKDALQLITSRMEQAGLSTEEMSFVLESLASDTTNLIPLLRDGGKAFDEIGNGASIISNLDAETLQRYTDAQRDLNDATRKLTIAFVDSGLLDTIVSLVNTFARWTSNLAETNPALLKIGTAVGAVAAAFGPFLLAIGKGISFFTRYPKLMTLVGTGLRGLLGPVGAVLLAVEGLYYAWKNWDTIKIVLSQLYNAAKTWLQNRLGDVLDWVGNKVDAVTGFFKEMYVAVVGNSYVPDMVDGIQREFARLDAAMVDPARQATMSVTEATREMASEVRMLLDRLFPEIAAARQKVADLALIDNSGLSDDVKAEARVRVLGGRDEQPVSVNQGPLDPGFDFDPIRADRQGSSPNRNSRGSGSLGQLIGLTQEWQTVIGQVGQTFGGVAGGIAQAIANVVVPALQQGTDQVLQMGQAMQGITNLLQSVFGKTVGGILGVGLQVASAFGGGGRIPGFANGTSFAPGGLAMVGELGPELVNLPRGSQVIPNHELRAANSGMHIMVGIDPRNGNVTKYVDSRIGIAAPAIAESASQLAGANAGRMSRRRAPGR